jgi:RND family efflux transporter MFP subunit
LRCSNGENDGNVETRGRIVSVENVVGRPRRARAAAAVLALASVATLTACQRAQEAPAPEIRPVRAITVGERSGGDAVALTGTVQAQTEVNLSFRVDGRMIERSVQVGDTVRAGQAIARLDPQNEESSLQAAKAQSSAAQARLVEARNNFARMKDLITDNSVSRAQYDQAEAMLRTAESGLETAQSQVTLAQNRLSYTTLVSEVAGVVTLAGPEPGEVVGAGRMIVQVAREGARDAVFDVPARVKDAAPANPRILVALTGDPKVTATGTVREVAPRADPITGTFRVRVRLLDPPPAMRMGATVTGRMAIAGAPSIEVPPSAVTRSDGKAAVWVVDPATGTVAPRPIEIRSSDPNRVEVASGLKPGDVVVTAGVQALRPGQKVRLVEKRP